MSRVIKFRVWEKSCKSLDDVFYKTLQLDDGEIASTWTIYPWDRIEQWTGLKDKKGDEVYEGDIVKTCVFKDKFPCDEVELEDLIGVVIFDSVRGYCVNYDNCSWPMYYMHYSSTKVIGNIHENQELLEILNRGDL